MTRECNLIRLQILVFSFVRLGLDLFRLCIIIFFIHEIRVSPHADKVLRMTTIDVRDKNSFGLNVSVVQYKEQLGKTVNEARLSFVK